MAATVSQPQPKPLAAFWAVLLALVVLAALGAGAIALERPTGQATGVVTANVGGQPLVGATVTVSGPITRHLLTGPDGHFSFAALPVGTYNISAKHRRFDAQYQESTFKVEEGKSVNDLAFKLARTEPTFSITNHQRVFTPKEPVQILTSGTNAPFIAVSLYKLNLAKAMALDPQLKLLHQAKLEKLKAEGLVTPVREWKQPIPTDSINDDDWFFKPVQVDSAAEGSYVVAMSATPTRAPEDQLPPKELKAAYWFDVSKLALVAKRSQGELVVYGADLLTKKPVKGAQVQLYSEHGKLAAGVTGADGLAHLAAPDSDKVWAMGRSGLSPALVTAGWRNDDSPYRIYAYSDRPVYRPGQKVYFKGFARMRDNSRYMLASGKQATITFHDGTSTVMATQQVTLSPAGTFDGSFDLPPEAALGEYDGSITIDKASESFGFKVADYRKPEYKVELGTDKARYVTGASAKVHVSTSYYFGAPTPNAKLAVTVYSAPNYAEHDPDEDFYASFMGNDSPESVWGFGDVVQQVEGKTDADGKFTLDVPLERATGDGAWKGDRTFTVAIEAMDASGRPVKGRASFPVTQGEIKLGVKADDYLYVGKKPIRLDVTARDYAGKPALADATVVVSKLHTEKKKTAQDDEYEDTSWVPTWTGPAHVDSTGSVYVTVPAQEPGNYQIVASTKDVLGNAIETESSVWVASESEAFMGDGTGRSGSLKIVLDKKVYLPGQTARALVVSPVADVTAFVTVEGTKLHETRVVPVHGTTAMVSFKVTQDFEPNAFIAACIVNGKEFLQAERSLNVTPSEKFLQVSVKSDKPRYEPGEKATYTVEAKDYQGHPVQAELSLGVVDEAVYAIEPDHTADIRGFFHGPRWNVVTTSYSFAEDYSGGLDKFAPDPRVRSKFEDTAAWYPSLKTGTDGKATVSFTLPDNLTTWVAIARGATADTRVGSASSTCVATKDLLVRLETPRFMVQGDHVVISAIAHSYLDAAQEVKLELAIEGLTTAAPLTQVAVVQPGDAKRATWEVDVPRVGDVKARVTVKSAKAADAMELTIPAAAFATPRFEGFAGELDADKPGSASFTLPAELAAGTAKLSFQLHASPLPAILAAVDYLHKFEYGCVEQTMSRFLPDVAIKPRLDAVGGGYGERFKDQNKQIADGLRRLASMQHGDGGWGWWEHDETQLEMTAYVIYGLAEARDAGFTPPAPMLKKGLDHLTRALPRVQKDVFTRDSVRRGAGADSRAFVLLALARWNQAPPRELDRLWADRADLSHFGLAQTALAFGRLNDPRKLDALELLRHAADASETQAHWASNGQEFAWQDDATEATAYALQAFLAIAPDDPLVGQGARWLQSKNARGYWESTKDTGVAAIALADFMKVRKTPPVANVDAVVKLDGREIAHYGASFQAVDSTVEVGAQGLPAGPHQLEVVSASPGALDFSGGVAYGVSAEGLAASASPGLSVEHQYYLLPASVYAKAKGQGTWGEFYDDKVVKTLAALNGTVKSGERVLVRVSVTSDRPMRYLALEDPLPAGCEVLDDSPASWSYWWDHQEYRDDKAAFFFNRLEPGTHTLYYVMRPTTAGRFHVLPPVAWAMYAPDVRARGAGSTLAITE